MHSPVAFPTLFKLMILLVSSVSSSQTVCPDLSGSLSCDCFTDSIECIGTQSYPSEIQDIFTNFSLASHVVIKVTNLSFEPDFKIRNANIENLTLGYGMDTPSSDIFMELGPSLVYLNLKKNSIAHIDDQLFSSLSRLTSLCLDFNELSNVQALAFSGLVSLEHLSIVSNSLYKIHEESFESLQSLSTLILSHNNITDFKSVQIKSSSLAVLMLDGCVIEGFLSSNTFPGIPHLRNLDLSYNKISEVKPHSLASLKELQFLNLSHNVIEFLQENAFTELSNLTVLDLKANKISLVKTSSFSGLLKLKFLDLSLNRLKAFPCDYTTDFASLEVINLQDNEIKVLTAGAFYYSPRLKELNLNGNNLECSCDLTDMAFYLVENSTMEKKDLDSIHCIETTTLGYMPITDYKNSKCIPGEPCKKSHPTITDDDYYDYDYLDELAVSPTTLFNISDVGTTLSVETSPTTDSLSSDPSTSTLSVTSSEASEALWSSESTSLEYRFSDENSTYEETTKNNELSTVSETVTRSETSPEITSTILSERSFSTFNSSFDNFTGSDTLNENTTDLKLPTYTKASPVNSSADYEGVTFSDTDAFSLYNITDSTVFSISAVDLVTSESVTSKITPTIFMNATSSAIDVEHSDHLTLSSSPFSESTTESVYTSVDITLGSTEPSSGKDNPILSVDSSSELSTSTFFATTSSISFESVTSSVVRDKCEKVKLSLNSSSLRMDSEVMKNFTYDGTTFCLKWTLGSHLPPKSRCIIKYTFIEGVKSENMFCPEYPGDIKLWSKNEKIYKFCLKVYGASIGGSCTKVSEKTLPETSSDATSTLTATNSEIVTESVDLIDHVETTTVAAQVDSESPVYAASSGLSLGTTQLKALDKTTPSVPVMYPERFNVTSFEIFFNGSSFAYAKWTVKEDVFKDGCNLTLTVSTQYFEHNEGSFPCKHHTHKLQNVQEDDIFKLCLSIQHKLHGSNVICRYSLSGANVDLEASSHAGNTSNSKSSLIPLVCLLIILMLVVIFIVYKNVFKKRQESERYDVRAEEEKSQRVQIRPSSTHDHSFSRSSYISKENPDI